MGNSNNLPKKIANASLTDLMNMPGTTTKRTVNENGETLQIKIKQPDYSLYAQIEEYTDGTRREVKTLSPKGDIQSKIPAITELRAKGHTQEQAADELGISQASVSRAEKK